MMWMPVAKFLAEKPKRHAGSSSVSHRDLTIAGVVTLAMVVMFSSTQPLFAQERTDAVEGGEVRRGVPVTQRERPELDPQGIRHQSFLIFPKVSVSEAYNDNIYSSASNEEGDFITEIAPSLSVRSDWSRHSLELFGEAKLGRYLDNTAEDYEDYITRANGRVDITRRSQLTGRLGHSALHEDRGEPNAASTLEPTEYTVTNAEGAFRQEFNRVNIRFGGTFDSFDYDDGRNAAGGVINNDDRDRDDSTVSVRVGYEIQPEYEAFVRGTYNQREYDDNVDDGGFNRDSDGYETVAGLKFDLSGVTFGDVFAGYREQEYDDSRLKTVSGPTFGAGITWNPTTLTTARFDLTQRIEETTSANASGYTATRIATKVDHELLRSVLIGADAAYTLNDYEGITREDDNYTGGLYGKYMMSRYVYTTLSFKHSRRDSTARGSDYEQNVFMLKLDLQL